MTDCFPEETVENNQTVFNLTAVGAAVRILPEKGGKSMANCPKCDHKLKITDWRQHCPYCGANIVIYDLQERLMKDADIAEVQHYHFQKKLDNLKASFIGSKLAITRIITTLLPIGGLFLPLAKLNISAVLPEFNGSVNALTIYNSFTDITGVIGELFSGALLPFGISLTLLLLSAVLILLKLLLLTLACSPKGKPRNIILNILQLGTAIGSLVSFMLMKENDVVAGSVAFGAYIFIFLLLVSAGIDIACLIQGIEVKHKQCYVGAIPIEEYFEMVEKGTPLEEIREKQYALMQKEQDEKEAKLKAEEEEKARKLAEEEAAKKENS